MALSTIIKKAFLEYLAYGHDSNGNPKQFLLEDTGEQKNVLHGKASGTITSVGVEATSGELRTVLNGKDSGGNIDPLRTNANQQLQVELANSLGIVQLDPALIPSSEGTLLDGSASLTSGAVYEVTFVIANIDGTNAVSVNIGVDVGAGGSLAAEEYFLNSYLVPAQDIAGPFMLTIAGDDDIRGAAGAANDAAIHFTRVERVA